MSECPSCGGGVSAGLVQTVPCELDDTDWSCCSKQGNNEPSPGRGANGLFWLPGPQLMRTNTGKKTVGMRTLLS